MAVEVVSLHAVEILDSRGRPTLSVELGLDGGPTCRAGVPSGASTGSGEAAELRDGDPARYGGKGTRQAAENVNGPIADAVCGRSFETLAELDQAVMELDGTGDKSRLGANAIVGVSMAASRAFAASAGVALWRSLTPVGVTPRLPVPHFNVVNGGAHAPNELDFQEFMLAPLGASSYADAVRAGAEVYAALKARLAAAGHATGWVMRVVSRRRSLGRRTCCRSWLARSPTRATSRAVTGWRSLWIRRPASSTETAPITWPGRASRRRTWSATTRTWWTGSRYGASRTAWPRTTGTAGCG
jgi:hypothetical protein